jgi:hypothetical protein
VLAGVLERQAAGQRSLHLVPDPEQDA